MVQLDACAKAAPAHVFVPLIFDGTAPRIGLPLDGCGKAYFGKRRPLVSREMDYADATRWAATLFPGRQDVHAFYYFEIEALGLVLFRVRSSPTRHRPTGRQRHAMTTSSGPAQP